MNVLLTRRYTVEEAVARALESLGHKVFFLGKPGKVIQMKGGPQVVPLEVWKRKVEAYEIDLIFCMSDSLLPRSGDISRLENFVHLAYWERRTPIPFVDPSVFNFSNRFTIWDGGPGEYLPCATEDHSVLKPEQPLKEIRLVAKLRSRQEERFNNRCDWQDRILRDFGNAIRVIDKIPRRNYDSRFKIMANSFATVGLPSVPFALTLRYFETMGALTPLFSYPHPTLRKMFKPGIHYVEGEELYHLYTHYLKYPDELNVIARNAYEEVMSKHTYVHRVKKVLENFEG